jgi:hypothetical protein
MLQLSSHIVSMLPYVAWQLRHRLNLYLVFRSLQSIIVCQLNALEFNIIKLSQLWKNSVNDACPIEGSRVQASALFTTTQYLRLTLYHLICTQSYLARILYRRPAV